MGTAQAATKTTGIEPSSDVASPGAAVPESSAAKVEAAPVIPEPPGNEGHTQAEPIAVVREADQPAPRVEAAQGERPRRGWGARAAGLAGVFVVAVIGTAVVMAGGSFAQPNR